MKTDNIFNMLGHKVLPFVAVLMLMLVSCSDDPLLTPKGPEGGLEGEGNDKVSVFHVTRGDDKGLAGNVRFFLANPESHENLEFEGELAENPDLDIFGERGVLTCRMMIGERSIPDGRYLLTISRDGRDSRPVRLLRFKGNVAVQEEYTPYIYSDLEGSGTEADPYMINSAGDFLSLQYGLLEDDFQGYGQYFKIGRGFELPRRSQIIDGREWAAVCFQGNLDGDGHTLRNLAYTGGSNADKDSGIGLFKSLFNATVKNLKLTGVLIANASGDVGIVAGSASGNTVIGNVAVDGTVQASGHHVGGIVGMSRGSLSISDITINTLTVTGNQHVSLLVGKQEGGKLDVKGVSTPTHVFSVEGQGCVGGIVGSMENGEELHVEDVVLEHSVDAESQDVKVITGGDCTGGVAGNVKGVGDVRFASCTVKAPVHGGSYAAALAGKLEVGGKVAVSSNLLTSVVNGNDYTGGFFGCVHFSGSELKFEGNNRYVVKQSAEAGVKGASYVGGIAGKLDAPGSVVKPAAPVEVAVNVTGTGKYVGGAFGQLEGKSGHTIDISVDLVNFTSPSMRVSGSDDGVGGFAGWCNNVKVVGSASFDLLKHVPKESELTGACGIVVKGASTVGGVVGVCNGGGVYNVACNAQVTATQTTGSDHGVGGVVGFCNGNVSGCAFFGSVSGTERIGGVVGLQSQGHYISNCLNYADIDGGKYAGGIAGNVRLFSNVPCKVKNCVNYGDLTNGKAVGGIVGRVTDLDSHMWAPCSYSYIERCGNYGDIDANGSGDYAVGGIVGDFLGHFGIVWYCSNHGNVSSQAVAQSIGGVVGQIGDGEHNDTEVKECMNTGEISCAKSSTKLGGVVGHIHSGGGGSYNNSIIHDCLNEGTLPTDQKNDTGGIVGMVTTCTDTYRTFNYGKVSHGNAIIGTHNGGTIFYHDHNYYLEGTGKSWPSSTSVAEDKLTDESVYKDFDFDKVWYMSGHGPRLRNCPFDK